MRADLLIKLGHRPTGRMPSPRHARPLRQQDRDLRRRASLALHQRHTSRLASGRKPCAKPIDIPQRGRQARTPHARRQPPQPRQTQRQQIATLTGRQRVQLVDHHPPQRGEQRGAVRIGQQQRQRFRRGQQHLRRPRPLASLVLRWRVAAAGFHLQGQTHLGDRRHQVALHILCQRLQRRDVERVQPLGRRLAAKGGGRERGQRGQKPGQCFARTRIGHQQGIVAGAGGSQHRGLMPPQRPAPARKPIGYFRRQGTGVSGRHRRSLGQSARKETVERRMAAAGRPAPTVH